MGTNSHWDSPASVGRAIPVSDAGYISIEMRKKEEMVRLFRVKKRFGPTKSTFSPMTIQSQRNAELMTEL